MKQDTLEYCQLVDENKLLRDKIQELKIERAWMIGMLERYGAPVTVGHRAVLTITKGGNAI